MNGEPCPDTSPNIPAPPALPAGCEEHQSKYRDSSWMEYSLFELGWWVHLFTLRSGHRTDAAKREKDLVDAQNYLDMMQSILTWHKENPA